jgi:hypothetical protein
MKNVLALLLVTTCLTSYGQVQDSLKGEGTRIKLYCGPPAVSLNDPLYLVSFDGKTMEFFKQTELSIDSLNVLNIINPDWIQSIHIFKGQDALDKYGDRAQYGAVFIELKKESAGKLPLGLKRRFIEYKN